MDHVPLCYVRRCQLQGRIDTVLLELDERYASCIDVMVYLDLKGCLTHHSHYFLWC